MNRRFPHPLRLAPALMVGTCVLVGELALAAIPDSTGVIHACFKQNNGQVRVVEPGTSCHPSEAAISWNANGAPGPGPTIAARIRMTGPVTFPGADPITLPLTGHAWTQGPDQFQEIVGRITWNRCENSGMFVDVYLDGVLRAHLVGTDPAPRFAGPASPVEFRVTSFEPGVQVQHTLEITVTEFACFVGTPGTVQTVSADVIQWE
jgi:hypothetical protein